MKLFTCTHCGQVLYFENSRREKCHYPLDFEATRLQRLPLDAQPDGQTYPFIISPDVTEKLAFIHQVAGERAGRASSK